MSEKKKGKHQIIEAYTDEQYKDAKAKGHAVIDRRMDSPYERKGESELVVIGGIDRMEDDEYNEDAEV
jgi:hypothetical protein